MKKNYGNVTVICRMNAAETLDFFLSCRGEDFYLFTTKKFSNRLNAKYRNGVRLEDVFHKTADTREQKLKDRILRLSKYVSCEYGLALFPGRQISHDARKRKNREKLRFQTVRHQMLELE